MRGFLPLPLGGVRGGSKADADKPSPLHPPKGRGRKNYLQSEMRASRFISQTKFCATNSSFAFTKNDSYDAGVAQFKTIIKPEARLAHEISWRTQYSRNDEAGAADAGEDGARNGRAAG